MRGAGGQVPQSVAQLCRVLSGAVARVYNQVLVQFMALGGTQHNSSAAQDIDRSIEIFSFKVNEYRNMKFQKIIAIYDEQVRQGQSRCLQKWRAVART